MADTEVLNAVFKVIDDATKTLREIRSQMGQTQEAAKKTGEAIEESGARHHLAEVAERLKLIHERYKQVGEAARSAFERTSELIPALAGLGAVGSLAGIFEMLNKVSETRSEFMATAEKIGITTAALGQLNYAARMSDVSIDKMQTGLMMLERNMGAAASGRNKDVVAIFQKMHFSLTGADGKIRDVTEVLPRLADAFEHTATAAKRAEIVRILFGRGGFDMLPLLRKGGAELKEFFEDLKGLGYVFSPADNRNLEEYHKSMIRLEVAVGGVRNAIAAQLMPVVKPIIDMFTNWLKVNREWLATKIKEEIIGIRDYLKSIDWDALSSKIGAVFSAITSVMSAFGGWGRVLETIVTIKVGEWLFGIGTKLAGIAKFGADAARAIASVGAASRGAAAAEGLAASRSAAAAEGVAAAGGAAEGAASGAAAGGALALVSRWLGPLGAFLYVMRPHAAGEGEDDALGRLNLRPKGIPSSADLSRIPFGPAAANWSSGRLSPQPIIPILPRIIINQAPGTIRNPLLSTQQALEDLRRSQSSGLNWNLPTFDLQDGGSGSDFGADGGNSFLGLAGGGVASAPQQVQVGLHVTFDNAPPGTRVATESSDSVNNVRVDIGTRFGGGSEW